MFRAIIFDWHGVCDLTKFERLLQMLSELSGRPMDAVQQKLKKQEREYVLGLCDPEAFWQFVQQQLNLDDQAIQKAKDSILTIQLNQPLWEVLPHLKKKYALAILSDCPMDKVNVIEEGLSLDVFNDICFSARVHEAKDHDQFFLKAAERLHILPEECLVVDDSERHIQTAQRLGFFTHHFSDTQKFLQYAQLSLL